MSARKKDAPEVELWGHCPKSDYTPHEYPAHAKVQLPAVPHGKLPPTGRSIAMQSGVGGELKINNCCNIEKNFHDSFN